MARTKGTARISGVGFYNHSRAMKMPPALLKSRLRRQRNDRVLRSDTAIEASAAKIVKPKRRHRADPWTPKKKVNATPKPRAPRKTHFTCRICIEEQTVDQFPRWVPPRRGRWTLPLDVPYNCISHLGRNPRKRNIDPVCRTCIGNAMSARLDMLGARQVGTGCLEAGCTEPWSHSLIMEYIPKGEPLEKFNMEMFNVWLEDTNPKPMTCISPDCTAMGLPDVNAPGYPQVTCHKCSARACAQCLVPWHEDVTCTEYSAKHVDEKMTDSEKETLQLMQSKDGKRCPNCQLVIEKDGGCDSMWCTGCKKYFNWATAASAVLGAKKAMPYIQNMPYWHNPGTVACEMDGILATVENARPPPIVADA